MDLEQQMRTHVAITQATKADACRRNGGPADLSPMLIWVGQDDKQSIAVIEAKDNTMGHLAAALGLVAKQDPRIVIFMSEGYATTVESQEQLDEFARTHKRGDLEKLHSELGPLSGVTELIAFNGIDVKTGRQMQAVSRFGYDDKGQPRFEDVEVREVPPEIFEKANVTFVFDAFYDFMKKVKSETN